MLQKRAFVNFLFENQTAVTFNNWVKDTQIPDETFFQSLAHSPQLGVPGAHLGKLFRLKSHKLVHLGKLLRLKRHKLTNFL